MSVAIRIEQIWGGDYLLGLRLPEPVSITELQQYVRNFPTTRCFVKLK
jgi:hypothetical protein